MRDQTPAQILDLLGDEDAEIDYTRLLQIINSISQVSSEVIYPTLESGNNTAKFVLLLSQLQAQNHAQTGDAVNKMFTCMNEVLKLTTMKHKALASGDFMPDSEHMLKIEHLRQVQRNKVHCWGRYKAMLAETAGELDTMKKVAGSLLAVQQSFSPNVTGGAGAGAVAVGGARSIKNDAVALGKVTISIKIIDATWAKTRARYAEMAAVLVEVERLGAVRGLMEVLVEDEETGEKKVVKMDLASLSLEFLRGAGEGAREEEEEGEGGVVGGVEEEKE